MEYIKKSCMTRIDIMIDMGNSTSQEIILDGSCCQYRHFAPILHPHHCEPDDHEDPGLSWNIFIDNKIHDKQFFWLVEFPLYIVIYYSL